MNYTIKSIQKSANILYKKLAKWEASYSHILDPHERQALKEGYYNLYKLKILLKELNNTKNN